MGATTSYYLRAFDSGISNWVYWLARDPAATPITTTPQYTGVLSSQMILYSTTDFVNTGFGGFIINNFITGTSFPNNPLGVQLTTGSVQTSTSYVATIGRVLIGAGGLTDALFFTGSAVAVS